MTEIYTTSVGPTISYASFRPAADATSAGCFAAARRSLGHPQMIERQVELQHVHESVRCQETSRRKDVLPYDVLNLSLGKAARLSYSPRLI
jgi:hypothetical protein